MRCSAEKYVYEASQQFQKAHFKLIWTEDTHTNMSTYISAYDIVLANVYNIVLANVGQE